MTALVAVVGPPGAGKTTVIAALAQAEGFPVFRLREAVRASHDLLADLVPSTDPLGWVGIEAVRRTLRAAFMDGRFVLGDGPVLLDNFPGTANQLDQLTDIAALVGRCLGLLELRANSATLAARIAARRVCTGCGSDHHAPAEAAAFDPDHCARCGTELARRDTDAPQRHRLRLARYRVNIAEIIEQAAHRQLPHVAISADRPPEDVLRLARHAIAKLTGLAYVALPTIHGADHDHHRAHIAYPSTRPWSRGRRLRNCPPARIHP